jgi:hypothetical protein
MLTAVALEWACKSLGIRVRPYYTEDDPAEWRRVGALGWLGIGEW